MVTVSNTKAATSAGAKDAKSTGNTDKKFPTQKTKKAQLTAMLQRKSGASVGALEKQFGWQPQTIRAAISGLRKSGSTIERSTGKSGAVYRIVEPAPGR
ncbi:DUF3489 domain-containing protein [Pseudohalocynthiibacter aestuariivivens]|nr:DUF3489 domain-containing protein [Pseudohalocynthiibacter aestuariivivens]QIE45188.1 DUF3489 domain-containing protein [Pseudohalocynthiibacter aestuariivivens]